ncbi:hypothetical protein Ddc_09266 [Ditylenchus destructor]|nr:hypothetical protein Ddc_09266 [Ditylenchus destructor]
MECELMALRATLYIFWWWCREAGSVSTAEHERIRVAAIAAAAMGVFNRFDDRKYLAGGGIVIGSCQDPLQRAK